MEGIATSVRVPKLQQFGKTLNINYLVLTEPLKIFEILLTDKELVM